MQSVNQFPPEKTICKFRWSYPIVHLSRGEVRTCDKPVNIKITESMLEELGTDAFINNPHLMERRREKLHGKRHSDCFNCIVLEDKGVQSTRTGPAPFTEYMNKICGKSESFDHYKYSNDSQIIRADHPDILEISLSNLCNLKCVYCSPVFSSKWEDEHIEFGEMRAADRERVKSLAPPSFEKYFWLWFDQIKDSLDRIVFIGGEPLIHDELYEYLNIIDEKLRNSTRKRDKEKLVVNIISNFSIPDKYFDRFLALLPKLSDKFIIHIESSIEAFGEKAEYIRSGASWNQITKNINKVLALNLPNVRYGLQMAVNNLCISSMKDLLVMAYELQEKYDTIVDFKENIIVWPEYLSPLILTPDFEKYLIETLDFTEKYLANEKHSRKLAWCGEYSHHRWQRYPSFINSIRLGIKNQASSDPVLKKQFYEFVNRNDQRRGSNFLKVFPEYEEFYDKCKAIAGEFSTA